MESGKKNIYIYIYILSVNINKVRKKITQFIYDISVPFFLLCYQANF